MTSAMFTYRIKENFPCNIVDNEISMRKLLKEIRKSILQNASLDSIREVPSHINLQAITSDLEFMMCYEYNGFIIKCDITVVVDITSIDISTTELFDQLKHDVEICAKGNYYLHLIELILKLLEFCDTNNTDLDKIYSRNNCIDACIEKIQTLWN